MRPRDPLLYSAMAPFDIIQKEPYQTFVLFDDEGSLNMFENFRPRAENYFKQVFGVEEFTIEATLDRSILVSVDPAQLTTNDYLHYLRQKNDALDDLFEEFKLKPS